MPLEVARHDACFNALEVLPIELPCQADPFGIIKLRDHLSSPAAELMLDAARVDAREMY